MTSWSDRELRYGQAELAAYRGAGVAAAVARFSSIRDEVEADALVVKRDSIEAHLNIVFAALAVSHWIEHQTGWSIKNFVRTARCYRTVQIRAGQQILPAADLIPDDLREAITKINSPDSAHWPKSGLRQVVQLAA